LSASSRPRRRSFSSIRGCCSLRPDYQRELAEKLNLCDIRTIRANPTRVNFEDPDGTLHQFSTDSCCNIRKVEPLERALSKFDGWITGRKRFQNADRGTIDFFENEGDFRIKVNPLAHWGREDLEEYMVENRLPRATLPSAARLAQVR
jgi:phosphoadenosine phosphosulfate reductase